MSEKRLELSDDADAVSTALYELDGAIRNAVTDVIVGLGNRADARERERTAATILAALIVRGAPLNADGLAALSTVMADALRDRLKADPEDVRKFVNDEIDVVELAKRGTQ